MHAPHRPHGLLRWPTYALGLLHRVANSRLDDAYRQDGLSLPTHAVLVCLAEYGDLSQQQICDQVAADRSDMVKRIDHLEALGQVTRRPDPGDRRRHVVSITPEGRAALRRGDQITQQVTDEVLAGLTAEERRTLHRLTLRALGEPAAIADADPASAPAP